MCGGGGGQALVNALTNPSANIQNSLKKKDRDTPAPAPAAPATDKTVAEAKQKQLNANRRNRRSTILTNVYGSAGGNKSLLGS